MRFLKAYTLCSFIIHINSFFIFKIYLYMNINLPQYQTEDYNPHYVKRLGY
jgi:hypothetical protein